MTRNPTNNEFYLTLFVVKNKKRHVIVERVSEDKQVLFIYSLRVH